jgi:hypothetical protein
VGLTFRILWILGILSQYEYGGYVNYEVEVTLHPLNVEGSDICGSNDLQRM